MKVIRTVDNKVKRQDNNKGANPKHPSVSAKNETYKKSQLYIVRKPVRCVVNYTKFKYKMQQIRGK